MLNILMLSFTFVIVMLRVATFIVMLNVVMLSAVQHFYCYAECRDTPPLGPEPVPAWLYLVRVKRSSLLRQRVNLAARNFVNFVPYQDDV